MRGFASGVRSGARWVGPRSRAPSTSTGAGPAPHDPSRGRCGPARPRPRRLRRPRHRPALLGGRALDLGQRDPQLRRALPRPARGAFVAGLDRDLVRGRPRRLRSEHRPEADPARAPTRCSACRWTSSAGRVVDLGELLGPEARAPCSTGSPPPTTGRRDSTSPRACSAARAAAEPAPRRPRSLGLATPGRQRRRGADRGAGPRGRLEPPTPDRALPAPGRCSAPKTAARVIRFRSLLAGLGDRAPASPTLAYDHGYSDQAHLNRDFREFAGTTPTVWEAGVNFVQDG